MAAGMEQKKLEALPLFMLQSLCKAKGQPQKGSKQELIDRLSSIKKQLPLPSGGKLGLGGDDEEGEVAAEPKAPVIKLLDSSEIQPAAKKSKVAESMTKNFAMPQLPDDFAVPSSSKVSRAGFDHRPLPEFRLAKCVHCSTLFNLQKARCTSPENFWCPDCRFKVMDPFNEVVPGHGILHSSLVTGPHLRFTLDTPLLKQWQDNLEDSVEVRMVRVNSDKISHVWPNEITVNANGEQLFKILPPDPKHPIRRDVAQDIINGLSNGTNIIEVDMADDTPLTDFAFAVVHAKACSVETVCSRVGKCEEADARERACELRSRSFEDASTTEDNVECLNPDVLKLICPITMDRVVQPARGRQCEHLQCFGLHAYCKSNFAISAHHNRWVCPICVKTLRPIDLYVDGCVERIIMETQEQALEEVTIAPDGSWKARVTS